MPDLSACRNRTLSWVRSLVAIALGLTTKLWIVGVPLGFAYATAIEILPTVYVFPVWKSALFMIWGIFLSLLLGVCCALLLGGLILGLIYQSVVRWNGGPFVQGDLVQILVGPHRGRVVRVYSLAQGFAVHVDLGGEEKETSKARFQAIHVFKERLKP